MDKVDKASYNKAIDDVTKLLKDRNLYTSTKPLTPYQEQYNQLVLNEIKKIKELKK